MGIKPTDQDEGSVNYRRHGERIAEELAFARQLDNPAFTSGRILCAGARDGYEMYLLEALHDVEPSHMVGIDDCASMVAVGLITGDYTMIHGDICDMGFLADDYFDMVFCSHTIEHIIRPHDALLEFSRVVRPGGSVWIIVPKESPGEGGSEYHLHHFVSLGNLVALCEIFFVNVVGWEVLVKNGIIDLIVRGEVPDGT
jgi:SAM-dependent methyltransferase